MRSVSLVLCAMIIYTAFILPHGQWSTLLVRSPMGNTTDVGVASQGYILLWADSFQNGTIWSGLKIFPMWVEGNSWIIGHDFGLVYRSLTQSNTFRTKARDNRKHLDQCDNEVFRRKAEIPTAVKSAQNNHIFNKHNSFLNSSWWPKVTSKCYSGVP